MTLDSRNHPSLPSLSSTSLAFSSEKISSPFIELSFTPAQQALLKPVNLDKVLASLPTVRIAFKLVKEEVSAETRRAYTKGLRRAFTAEAINEAITKWRGIIPENNILGALTNYDIHHKNPVSWGGGNDFDNLVLIDKDLHARIHKLMHKTVKQVLKVEAKHKKARGKVAKKMREELMEIPGVTVGPGRKVFIEVPWPEGRICIPQLVLYEKEASPSAPISCALPLPAHKPSTPRLT